MSSGQLPRIPEPRGSDPDWFRQMKIWCADVVRALDRNRVVADNATLRERNGVLSAIPDHPAMFKVEQTGPDSVSVRAGVASRYDGTTVATYEMTIVGGGTSASPFDGVELTALAVSQWIVLVLDEDAGTLVASGTGSTVVPDSVDGTVIPIALVIMDEGAIVRIFQGHAGAWYSPVVSAPVLFEAVTEYADYLDCAFVASLDANQHPVPVDPGEEAETLVKVLKPWLLRRTPFDTKTRDGITYTYPVAPAFSPREAEDSESNTETQRITPSYSVRDTTEGSEYAGELIHAIPAGNGEWQDINTAGRCWAAVFEVD